MTSSFLTRAMVSGLFVFVVVAIAYSFVKAVGSGSPDLVLRVAGKVRRVLANVGTSAMAFSGVCLLVFIWTTNGGPLERKAAVNIEDNEFKVAATSTTESWVFRVKDVKAMQDRLTVLESNMAQIHWWTNLSPAEQSKYIHATP